MITCANEAHEEGDVACYDTPGVYLHTMNDEGVITFRSNIKYLLLKLLCTLALLCEGTPLKHLDLTSLESELSITIAISNFLRVGQTEQGDRRAEPTSALRSPTTPPPQNPPPEWVSSEIGRHPFGLGVSAWSPQLEALMGSNLCCGGEAR